MLKNIDKLLKLDKPWEYDFKFEDKTNNNNGSNYPLVAIVVKEIDSIALFANYLGNDFDTDGTIKNNHVCNLSREIYRHLWSFDDVESSGEINRYGKVKEPNFSFEFGPDTMNTPMSSVFIPFEKRIKNNHKFKSCFQVLGKNNRMENFSEAVLKRIINVENYRKELQDIFTTDIDIDCVNSFCKYCTTIGNYVLVPKGFNSPRGTSIVIRDFLDLSLFYLKEYGYRDLKYKFDEQNFDKSQFSNYINVFYLWDYVYWDKIRNEYNVKSLIQNHLKFISKEDMQIIDITNSNTYEQENRTNENNIQNYLLNVLWCIKRRGVFMTLMLEFQDCDNLEFNKFNKDIYSGKYKSLSHVMKDLLSIHRDKLHKYDLNDSENLFNKFST